MSIRKKKFRLPGWKSVAGVAGLVAVGAAARNEKVQAFVGSKLAPVAQYIPGQVARRKRKNAGK